MKTIIRCCRGHLVAERALVSRILVSVVAAGLLLLFPWALASATSTDHSGSVVAGAATHPPHDDVLHATLPNGLKVVIVPNHLAPVVTAVMNYHVGSNEAPAGFPGMAHAQEHMMFRGSPGLTTGQLSAIAAAMGGRFDADTQQAVTQYFFTVPARYLPVVLHIEAIRMRAVSDSNTSWIKERKAIEQEVARDLSSPGYLVYKQILASMFHGTPYAHDALGTHASFEKTTGAMLHAFYAKWYAPNNATLVISGDVDPGHALRQVKQLLGPLTSSQLPARPQLSLQPVHASTIRKTTDQPYGSVLLAFRMPGFNSPDHAAAEVLAQVLSNQRSTLYSRLVPTGKALQAGFSLNSLRPASIGLAIAAFPRGATPQPLLNSMRHILKSVAHRGVSADLVKAAKRRVITLAQAQLGSIPGLAMQWSQSLVVEQQGSPQASIHAIEQVTVQDVDRIARQYLNQDDALVAVLTPGNGKQPAQTHGFGGKESFTPTHVEHVKLPDWAAQALGKLHTPVARLQPTDMTLPNGLRLIVQPESVSHAVHVYGHIKNRPALAVPAGREGVDLVLGRLLNYGTTSMNRVAFQKALDKIGATASEGTDFSLLVLHQHFDRGMQLLADGELRPGLPQKAFAIARQQVASAVAGEIASPGFHMHQALRHALYPANDPTLRHATRKSVASLSLQDVHDYYQKAFRPDLCTIVIVGDITPHKAKQVVEKYFGDWQASGPAPATRLPAVPLNGPHTAAVNDPLRIQDKVVLAETLGMTRSSPAYYALTLGNQVLSGNFYASRLYRTLREKRGLVYYVGSSIDALHNRATFTVDYGAESDHVVAAEELVKKALRALQTTPIRDAELHRAQASLIRQVPLSHASESAIAGGLLAHAVKGLPLNESVLAADRYLQLTAQDIREAYKKWIRPDDLVRVSLGPTPTP